MCCQTSTPPFSHMCAIHVCVCAFMQAHLDKQELKVAPLAALPAGAPPGVACFAVQLSEPLTPGEMSSIKVYASFTDAMTANPAKLAQGEPHLVEYWDNLYVVSPYTVSVQETKVGAAASNLFAAINMNAALRLCKTRRRAHASAHRTPCRERSSMGGPACHAATLGLHGVLSR